MGILVDRSIPKQDSFKKVFNVYILFLKGNELTSDKLLCTCNEENCWRSLKMFLAAKYYIKAEKMAEYKKWLLSDDAKDLFKREEKETGFKYIDTYFPILGFGDDAIEDWYEIPNWATLDKTRTSKTNQEYSDKTWEFMDNTRFASSVVYRTTSDVQTPVPPKKK